MDESKTLVVVVMSSTTFVGCLSFAADNFYSGTMCMKNSRDVGLLKRNFLKIVLLLGGLYSATVAAQAGKAAADLDAMRKAGESIFNTQCAACHLGAMPEAPLVPALKLYTPDRVVEALSTGVMSTQGIPLSKQDKKDVAFFLTGKTTNESDSSAQLTQFMCSDKQQGTSKVLWNGWGGDVHNTRAQFSETKLTSENVAKLELKWAFAFPETTRVRAQPTVTEDTIYMGSQEGYIYAIDSQSGCVRWLFEADAEVRGGIHLATDQNNNPTSLYFGDFKANAYSIDALNGTLNWKTDVHPHPLASITGSVTATSDTVFVPISSSEVISAARDDYECCSFRGTLVALDAKSGEIKWESYTTEEPKPTKPNKNGVMQHGPSGAPIWSRPTLDEKRGLVYVTTGQNYSSPATLTSDAILAFAISDGTLQWSTQVTKNDAWNGACVRRRLNCPEEDGPDFDIGTGALLVTHFSGKDVLVIGQKSGVVYAFDPDNKGKILWGTRVGSGGTMGGVHWGLSTDKKSVFVGVSDLPTNNPYKVGDPQPGVNSLDLLTGESNWQVILQNQCPADIKFQCFQGVSAAVSYSSGVLYAGGLDGILRAYDAKNGKNLWEENTHKTYETINGVPGNGGAIEADGPVIANGNLYITSGYDKWGEIPGNVLLVYSLPDKNSAAGGAK